ncbi:MAG: enoyl-CoA hydratase/isomerase family protein [Rhodomicrobium sp.]
MLEIGRDGNVCLLTIDRPHRRNAIGHDLVLKLAAELQGLDADQNVRAIVIAGKAPGFCAGSDLKELSSVDLPGMCTHEAETARLCRSFAFLQKPIIAAVDGFALGGGLVLAISCDIVVTSPGAKWGLPEVSIGWLPPWGLQALVARTGPAQARRLTWGEETFDGREAYRLGLADFLAPEESSAVDTALKRAQKLALLPPPAVAATKRFFAPIAAGLAEPMDALANAIFAENCGHPVARQTLQKYGVKL